MKDREILTTMPRKVFLYSLLVMISSIVGCFLLPSLVDLYYSYDNSNPFSYMREGDRHVTGFTIIFIVVGFFSASAWVLSICALILERAEKKQAIKENSKE